MLPTPPPSMLVFFLLQGAPSPPPPEESPCEDVRRIELSLEPTVATREVCISPGLVTSFLFDAPTQADLQDEVRFMEVMRGRSGIGLVPPRDMAPGERVRLTVRIDDGATQERVTFILVAYSGQATRQVEVYRDQRSRESYQYEVAQERANVRQLLSELRQMRSQLHRVNGLRGLISSAALGLDGIQTRPFPLKLQGYSESGLRIETGASYRSSKSVAVQLKLKNTGEESWTVADTTLTVDGEPLKGLLWVAETIAPNETRYVVVEVDAKREELRGSATLTLRGKDSRVITIPEFTFP